jgi:hypothetical protein
MVRIFIQRAATYLFMVAGWVLAGIRTTLDLVGWSTAPDDVPVAMSRADQFFLWMLSIPWWVPWGFALISTMWLMWASWHRTVLIAPAQPDSQASMSKAAQVAPLKIVKNAIFKNQAIKIDDMHYIDCTFQNCQFVYNGGQSSMSNCIRTGGGGIVTTNPAVYTTIDLLKFAGIIPPDDSTIWHDIPREFLEPKSER